MLTIKEYDQDKYYRKLKNGPDIFHEALKYVLKGETHFHVSNENGEDFDLLYLENDRKAKSDESFPDSSFFKDELIFPPYFFYDETDDDKVMAYLLEGFDEIFFEEANEYTVTIAGIALRKLSCRVTFRDRRAELFPWLKDRVRISPEPEAASLLYVQKDYYPVYMNHYVLHL